jgi:predicted transcriptional regulator
MKRAYKNARLWQENALGGFELAKASGVGYAVIWKALKGRSIRASSVRKICAVLQRTPVNVGLCPVDPDIDLKEAY